MPDFDLLHGGRNDVAVFLQAYIEQRMRGTSDSIGPAELSMIWLSPRIFTVNSVSDTITPVEHAAIT